MAKTLFTKEQDEILKQLYPILGTDVADFLPFTKKHISTRAYGLGLRVHHETKSQKAAVLASRPRPELCGVNADFFTKVNTPEIAYLLGIIWADGYVDKKSFRIVLSIVESDANTIEALIMKTGKWNVRIWQPPGNRKSQKSFVTHNKVIHNLLSSCNYQLKSVSSACKILDLIPEEMRCYFWRGYFDGDGCVCNRSRHGGHSTHMSLAGSLNQDWTFVEKLFDKLNIKFKIQKRDNKHKSSCVVLYNVHDINKFFEFIYPGKKYDEIGFKRKYEKFMEMISNCSESRYSTVKKLSH